MTEARRLLTINAGSSSLKFAVYEAAADGTAAVHLRGQIAGIRQGTLRAEVSATHGPQPDWAFDPAAINDHVAALHWLVDRLGLSSDRSGWLGIGHRVVHGGTLFKAPVTVGPSELAQLESLIPLAPLHQPHNVGAIKALHQLLPDLPQVACFDTAFHASNPDRVTRFALPERFWQQGIRRYGFHGLSYEAILARLSLEKIAIPPRLIVAHLGNGASMAAVKDGIGHSSTMGFSTMDGLIMGTRPGSLDPGVVLHLLHQGMDLGALEKMLYNESGLLGLSGLSSDMKTLSQSDNPKARMAIDIYCHRIATELGRLTAELQGIDMLVFTGGVGENATEIRERVAAESGWLGISLDMDINATTRGQSSIVKVSSPDATVPVLVVPTDEEGIIARHCIGLLAPKMVG